MRIANSYDEFRRFLKQRELKVTGLLPADGIPAFQTFYRDVRADDAQERDGDGLACYFGMSRDGGAKYEVGMVRLFRVAGASVHEAGHRLRLSFTYPFVETILRPGLDKERGWPEGNKICWNPNDQSDLIRFISESVHINAVLSHAPKLTRLRFEKIWGVF
jgi:hypothetical protein